MLGLEGLDKIDYTVTETFENFKVCFHLVWAAGYDCLYCVTDCIAYTFYGSNKLFDWDFINDVLNLNKKRDFFCGRYWLG